MEGLRLKTISLLVAWMSLVQAQWFDPAFNLGMRFQPSGSEGPCGYMDYPQGVAAVQNHAVAQRPGGPINAPVGQSVFNPGQQTNPNAKSLQAFNQQAQQPSNPQAQQLYNQQAQQPYNQQAQQLYNQQAQQPYNQQAQQPYNQQAQQASNPQQTSNQQPQIGFNQQSQGLNPGQNMFNQQYPFDQLQQSQNGLNALPAGVNYADILGLPRGISVNQARRMELDANNRFDLDIPEQGAHRADMNVPATGRMSGNPFLGQNIQGLNGVLGLQGAQGGQNVPGRSPFNIPARPIAPTQGPLGVLNNGSPPAFVYGNRVRCQCDHAGDCNAAATVRGMNYNFQCLASYVCCCRIG